MRTEVLGSGKILKGYGKRCDIYVVNTRVANEAFPSTIASSTATGGLSSRSGGLQPQRLEWRRGWGPGRCRVARTEVSCKSNLISTECIPENFEEAVKIVG